jgi:hypothetical protein
VPVRDNGRVLDRLARGLYERLGRRYKLVLLAVEIPAAILIALGFVGVLSSYYQPSLPDAALIALTTSGFTAIAVAWAISRQARSSI